MSNSTITYGMARKRPYATMLGIGSEATDELVHVTNSQGLIER